MKYEIIYLESITGSRTIKAIVEADSEDEATDRIYDYECEDWDVKEECLDPVDIEILSIEPINDSTDS